MKIIIKRFALKYIIKINYKEGWKWASSGEYNKFTKSVWKKTSGYY